MTLFTRARASADSKHSHTRLQEITLLARWPSPAGLGAVNICDLDTASARDALPALLSGKAPAGLVIATTRLLTEMHPHILKAVLVSSSRPHPRFERALFLTPSSVQTHWHMKCDSVDVYLPVIGTSQRRESPRAKQRVGTRTRMLRQRRPRSGSVHRVLVHASE